MSQGDFLFSETADLVNTDSKDRSILINKIQPIIFNEFQPDIVVYLTKLFTNGVEATLNAAKAQGGKLGGLIKIFEGVAKEAGESVGQKLVNDLTLEYSVNPAALYEGQRPSKWCT